MNGSNGNHSAVAKNWTIGAKTENLLNETPNGSQNQFPQYVTAHFVTLCNMNQIFPW